MRSSEGYRFYSYGDARCCCPPRPMRLCCSGLASGTPPSQWLRSRSITRDSRITSSRSRSMICCRSSGSSGSRLAGTLFQSSSRLRTRNMAVIARPSPASSFFSRVRNFSPARTVRTALGGRLSSRWSQPMRNVLLIRCGSKLVPGQGRGQGSAELAVGALADRSARSSNRMMWQRSRPTAARKRSTWLPSAPASS